MKLTDVIRRPIITEKTTLIREEGRTLVFQVSRDANKIDIKRAVEALLGSKVESVRTSVAHGKVRSYPSSCKVREGLTPQGPGLRALSGLRPLRPGA